MNIKFFIALTIYSVIFSASAGTINLNIGDSITIYPNTTTTITCGGNGDNNCRQAISNLTLNFDQCTRQRNSVEECLLTYWPQFTRSYKSCVDAAYPVCIQFCKTAPLNLDCLDLCR
jgi:hypothetical protein